MKNFHLALVFSLAVSISALAQTSFAPDRTVSGVKLLDRVSAKKFLDGFQARTAPDGRPVYYFYNRMANQVFKLTGQSMEDRFLIVEFEVYGVDKGYTAIHFQADKISHFKTEKDVFVGYKQSKTSAILGIPNVDGNDETGPKTIIKKFGEPMKRSTDGAKTVFEYMVPSLEMADDAGKVAEFGFSAVYEFENGKLRRFSMKLGPTFGRRLSSTSKDATLLQSN